MTLCDDVMSLAIDVMNINGLA